MASDKDPKVIAKSMEAGRQFVVVLVSKRPELTVKDAEVEAIRTHVQEKTLPYLQSGWIRAIPLDCWAEFEGKLKELQIRARESRGCEETLCEVTVMPFPVPGQKLAPLAEVSDRVAELVKKANSEARYDVFPTVIYEGVKIVRMMLSAEYDSSGALTKAEQERVNSYMEKLAGQLNEFEELAEKKDKDGIAAYHKKYHPEGFEAPKVEKVTDTPVPVPTTEDLVDEFKGVL